MSRILLVRIAVHQQFQEREHLFDPQIYVHLTSIYSASTTCQTGCQARKRTNNATSTGSQHFDHSGVTGPHLSLMILGDHRVIGLSSAYWFLKKSLMVLCGCVGVHVHVCVRAGDRWERMRVKSPHSTLPHLKFLKQTNKKPLNTNKTDWVCPAQMSPSC